MPIIKLNDGSDVLVDAADYASLAKYKWVKMQRPHRKAVYAARGINTPKGRRCILMHREIIGALPGQEVDHINGNGLDNRRANLRFVTSSQNHACRAKALPKSGFKGVSFHPATPNRFRATIAIGTFDTAEDAAHAYDEIAVLLWGEFARPNFPIAGLENLPFNHEQAMSEAAE